jgi:hypothetical protein
VKRRAVLATEAVWVWWDKFGFVAGPDGRHAVTMHCPGRRDASEEYARIKFGSDDFRVKFVCKGQYLIQRLA